jgi:uncharacterized protein YajQ (UPF0234 family)
VSKEHSFDIVSKVDMQEVDNAINQTVKEIASRFDFKGSKSDVHRLDDEITMISDDEYKLRAVIDILQSKMVRRGVSLKSLQFGKVEPAASHTVRQVVKIVQGIDAENAKQIVRQIRDSKLKVQATIQGNQIRVSGKNKDDLQAVIQILKEADIPLELQFVNFR